MSLDLNKLSNKLDEALIKETTETLTKFLNDKRMTNNKQQTAVKPFDLQKFLAGEPITTLGGHEVVAFRYDTNFEGLHPLKVAIKETTGLISHYQYSIDGDPLGTINSNYILCMKDTELSMTNNKQTSIEQLFHKLWDTPKDKFTWYAILKEYIAMHKKECVDLLNKHNDIFDTSEDHYNQTFGSDETIQ